MDVPQFEQAILKLAFETDARITTASVAYYLGLPSRRCNELLNALLAEGVLELDSDGEGNLFYRVPHKPAGSDALIGQLRQARENPFAASNRLLSGASSPLSAASGPQRALPEPTGTGMESRHALPSGLRFVSPGDAQDESEPLSVHAHAPQRVAGRDASERDDAIWGEPQAHASEPIMRPTPPQKPRRQRTHEPLAGVARRRARPDATINRCGASPLLVSDSVRCDPRPVAAKRPVLTRCAEREQSKPGQAKMHQPDPQRGDNIWGQQHDQWPVTRPDGHRRVVGESAPNRSTMLASRPAGELVMRDDMLTQPEHQPGMALLLSLILCGTGQIYNGEVSKGIMMMVLCFLLWFVLLGWVVHIWSIVDSVVVAERVNRSNG